MSSAGSERHPVPSCPAGLQFRLIAETAPLLLWMEDATGKNVYVNPRGLELHGRTAEEMRGIGWMNCVHPDDVAKWEKTVSPRKAAREPFECTIRMRHADGEYRWFHDSGAPAFGAGGEFLGYVGACTDVTERKRADDALRESEDRFLTLATNLRHVLYVAEPDWRRIHYVSPAYETLWGRSTASLYREPMSWLEGVHPEDRQRVEAVLAEGRGTGSFSAEYRVVRPDETERWVFDSAFEIQDERGVPVRVAGVMEDITERRRVEREVLEIAEREQQRIGQDLHDGLAQHLTGLALMCKALEHRLGGVSRTAAEDVGKVVDLVNQAIVRTRDLVRGLYPATLAREGLSGALAELAGEVERAAGLPVRFRSDGEGLRGDAPAALHLYRIAQEAVHNAVRHGRPTRITIDLAVRAGTMTMRIHDDGEGLPDGADRGPGLGLRIMRYRANLIGASIKTQLAPNRGTEVVCVVARTAGGA